MERELMKLFDAARKAADLAAAASDAVSSKGPEVSRCVDALNQLKTFPVTHDILVSTQLVRKLRPLTKHPTEKIHRMASDLLDLWRKIVIEEPSKSEKNGTASAVKVEKIQRLSALKAEKISSTETIKEAPNGGSTKHVKVEKKEADGNTATAEKINRGETGKIKKIYIDGKTKAKSAPKLITLVKFNDPLRDKFRKILVEALSKVPSETDEDMLDQVNACDLIWVAVTVESVMFRKMGKSNGTSNIKYRSIMFNMKDPKNPDFRRKVLVGEVNPERLITMTPEEMASEQRQREDKEIKEKALSRDPFKCGRCGKRDTSYYQMQTRSADEPRTTYVTCVNCNNQWEFCERNPDYPSLKM
ncbi:hypothetical protein ES319_A02G002800v1 [Gossypium barbadense]|uniref:Transcription elongation factor n=2 Tax=Gossypium TaxID=3633 RepID=A0A5J5WHD7_GOSBA|nr:hypothetical protein ES319_A02G002800v1 [Gossypium barbadense]TYH26618.1 hypothetical protein ES288_A02G003000v1 [Gossypium darwinii]